MTVNADPLAWLLLAGFVLLLVFVFRLARKQMRDLHGWLEQKAASEGWQLDPEHSPVSPESWMWFRFFYANRGVALDRLAVNPAPGLLEAGFTLILPAFGSAPRADRDRWAPFRRRHAGLGMIVRLPHPISPGVLVFPASGPWPLWKQLLGVELPDVLVGDEQLAAHWSVASEEPGSAAQMLMDEAGLREALIEIAATVLWRRLQSLVIELRADRATLLTAQKTVGRQPFDDLTHAAELLAAGLEGGRLSLRLA